MPDDSDTPATTWPAALVQIIEIVALAAVLIIAVRTCFGGR